MIKTFYPWMVEFDILKNIMHVIYTMKILSSNTHERIAYNLIDMSNTYNDTPFIYKGIYSLHVRYSSYTDVP